MNDLGSITLSARIVRRLKKGMASTKVVDVYLTYITL